MADVRLVTPGGRVVAELDSISSDGTVAFTVAEHPPSSGAQYYYLQARNGAYATLSSVVVLATRR
ncbi:MAG TPA: hypothetical protein VNT30_10460 [Stellaceae bacterium]|nr:hypothetical protein [Stellaceae bacterium]